MGKDLKYTSECKNYYIFISHATDMGNLQLPALLLSYYLTLKDAIKPVATFSSAHGCHIITQSGFWFYHWVSLKLYQTF